MANGYNGNKGVSTANQDVLIVGQVERSYYELSFINDIECTIIINGGNPIPIAANQGVMIDENDKKISSIVIVQAGVAFRWFAKY